MSKQQGTQLLKARPTVCVIPSCENILQQKRVGRIKYFCCPECQGFAVYKLKKTGQELFELGQYSDFFNVDMSHWFELRVHNIQQTPVSNKLVLLFKNYYNNIVTISRGEFSQGMRQ